MAHFEIKDLSFSYPMAKDKMALDHINLNIEQGEYITVCGKSGSGKTTLLKHLKSVLTPHGTTDGEIYFEGKLLKDVSLRDQSAKIGYVMQNPDNQIVTDKVWHELAFGLESLGMDQKTIRLRVAEMASYFGIQGWFHKNVSELSGGQKQLLNLASIMAMQPTVLILDEPTSQLDPIAATDFLNTVRKINLELGTTIIIYDLSEKKNLCNLVGREEEIKKIIKEICIKKKSVLLKGSYGAGKTAIVEKLARDIKNKKNIYLEGKTIFYLNKKSIKIGNTIDKNIKKIVDFCKESDGKIILFIEDIHNFYEVADSFFQYMKPFIEDGSILIIGTYDCSKNERFYSGSDLVFKNIIVETKNLELDVEILLSYIKDLEQQYNIKLNINRIDLNSIINLLIEASTKCSLYEYKTITTAKEIIEDAFCEGIYEKKEFITLEDIVISIIECEKLESEARLELANKTKELLNCNSDSNELNSEPILNNTPQKGKKYIFGSKKRV